MSLAHDKNRIKKYPILLKRPHSNSSTSLYLRTSFLGKPFKYGLGDSIVPELWDKMDYIPITDRSIIKKYKKANPYIELDLKNIELTIVQVEGIIERYLLSIKRDVRLFDQLELKQRLNKALRSSQESEPKEDQSHFVLDYIEQVEAGMINGGVGLSKFSTLL